MMKISALLVILAIFAVSVHSAGWVAQADYEDGSCTTVTQYNIFQVGTCSNETYASVTWTMSDSGSLTETVCTSNNCSGDACFPLPITEGHCYTATNSSYSYTYYEEFPSKLANINPVEILVMFKGDSCDASNGINAVAILPQSCYQICTNTAVGTVGTYCSVPSFLNSTMMA